MFILAFQVKEPGSDGRFDRCCARYSSHGSIALFGFHADAGGGAYFMVLRFLSNQLQAAGAAFQLITRIPIPIMIPFVPQVLARSVVYYPLVGTVLWEGLRLLLVGSCLPMLRQCLLPFFC